MENFALCIAITEYNYFKNIIKALPRDTCHIFLSEIEENSLESSLKDRKEMENLGFKVEMLTYDAIIKYDNIVASSCFFDCAFTYNDTFKKAKKKILLNHSVDTPYCGTSHSAQYFIGNSERSIMNTMYTKEDSPEMYAKLLTYPPEHLNYGAYTGIFHIEEWETKRFLPKEVLRKELAEYLEIEIPEDKPVIAFIEDFTCNHQQVLKGIKALQDTNKFTIIVKAWACKDYPKDTILWKGRLFAPNLLRFTADYILAGFSGGTLSSSIMLGLPVIPYYTTMVKSNLINGSWVSFYKAHTTTIENLKGFLVNLLDTDILSKRILNKEYLIKYQNKLPEMQQANYGKYLIKGAGEKTAELIVRVFNEGGFGNDQLGLAVRPEFLNLYPEFKRV